MQKFKSDLNFNNSQRDKQNIIIWPRVFCKTKDTPSPIFKIRVKLPQTEDQQKLLKVSLKVKFL